MISNLHKNILLTILVVTGSASLFGQKFISSEYLRSYDKAHFLAEYSLFVQNAVDLYRINYTTVNTEGEVDTASGLVILPDNNNFTYSVIAYHHGTVGSRYDVPSYESFEILIPSIYAAYGFISIAPDYIGLGDSKGFHPYIHAASEAWNTKDMLIAAEEFYKEKDYTFKRRVMMSGYSQGGHAGMAAHRLLETEDLGFEVVAATHMSGPYDISSGMKDLLLSEEEYPLVAYMPYVALSFDLVYGIFNGDINNFFLPNYSDIIMRFYREEIDLWTMNDLLVAELNSEFGKAIPAKMIVPQVLADIVANENHPVNVALRDNDVYDWTPTADTKLYYCGKDEQVAFQNSLTAEAKMKENGTKLIEAVNIDPNGTHSSCVSPAVTRSVFFFLSFRQLTDIDDEIFVKELAIHPNPVGQGVITLIGLEQGQSHEVSIFNTNGQLLQSISNVKYDQTVDVSNLSSGFYTVKVTSSDNKLHIGKIVIP